MKLRLSCIEMSILIVFLICLLLGSWQVKRLVWKQDILAKVREYNDYKPIELENFHEGLKDILYKKVKVRGRLHHDKEIHLYSGGKLAYGSDGYLIFTPLESMDGEFILINRGWVPQNKKDQLKRAATLIMEIVEIEGIVIEIREPKWKMFSNNLDKNVWLWLDSSKISEHTELILPSYYIMQQGNWNILPINSRFSAEMIRNDHLQYALTWFSLAALSLAFFIILRIKKR